MCGACGTSGVDESPWPQRSKNATCAPGSAAWRARARGKRPRAGVLRPWTRSTRRGGWDSPGAGREYTAVRPRSESRKEGAGKSVPKRDVKDAWLGAGRWFLLFWVIMRGRASKAAASGAVESGMAFIYIYTLYRYYFTYIKSI